MNQYDFEQEHRIRATERDTSRHRYGEDWLSDNRSERPLYSKSEKLTEQEIHRRAVVRYKSRQHHLRKEGGEKLPGDYAPVLGMEIAGPSYGGGASIAGKATSVERAEFLRKTYLHLAGAVIAYFLLSAALLRIPGIEQLIESMVSGITWLLVLGLFIGMSYVAERWARSSVSRTTQYVGLGLYIVAEAFIVLPLLYFATLLGGPEIILVAALITGVVFIGLSAIVYVTAKDFSSLRSSLYLASFIALGLIVLAVLFGLTLGIFFIIAMIGLACGYILYHTSEVLHHYHTDQHVAASLALFACVAFLFWYILRAILAVISIFDF